jgi:hypothetical protein
MMETELGVLAGAAATALVGVLATDGWEAAKTGFARLLGCNDEKRRALAESRLNDSAEEIAGAEEEMRDDVRARVLSTWQTRFSDFLQEEPQAADALRIFVKQYREKYGDTPSGVVSITQQNSGGVNVANTGKMGEVRIG